MSNNQWLWPLCICLWAAAGRSLGSWCLRTLVWLVNFDCLVLQCKDISLRTLNTMNGGMSSITRHSYLYLWLWISLRKPLLDVTCDGEKHLLHIQVCLGTLKDTEICESKTTANSVFLFKKNCSLKVSCKSGKQHTVSKNLIPYSSASACPFAVGTAWSNSSSKIYYLANWRKRIKHLTTYFKQEIQSENSQTFKETKWVQACTLLLSSISALLPTKILLTLSEACCSMFRIQFRMSVF